VAQGIGPDIRIQPPHAASCHKSHDGTARLGDPPTILPPVPTHRDDAPLSEDQLGEPNVSGHPYRYPYINTTPHTDIRVRGSLIRVTHRPMTPCCPKTSSGNLIYQGQPNK
jgi:hypothetical protein